MSQNQFTKLTFAVYSRVSSMDQVNGTLTVRGSLEEQETKARSFGETQGWEFTKIYREEGISGEKFEERIALQTMIEDARLQKFQVLIVKTSDRLARDQEVFFRITKILNHYYNIQIMNLANPSQIVAPDSFVGRRNPMLIVQQGFDAMMSAFDQARRFDMLMEGKKRQARAGRYTSPYIFYGYKLEYQVIGGRKVDRVPVPEPSEYWVLEILPQLVLEENLSEREIAVRLEEMGVMPRKAAHWGKSMIAKMLTQPFYGGKVSYGRQVSKTDEKGKISIIKNTNPETHILADHRYLHPWTWETFQKIQEVRSNRATRPAKQNVSRSPVAGILVCGYCHHSMILKLGSMKGQVNHWAIWKDGSQHFRPYTPKTPGPDYFICGYHNSSPNSCQVNRVRVTSVLAGIIDELTPLAEAEKENPSKFYEGMQVSDTSSRTQSVETRLNTAKAELAETIPAKLDRLNRGYLNGMVRENQYPELTKIIDEEKDRLIRTVLTLESELRKIQVSTSQAEEMRNFLAEFRLYKESLQKPIISWDEGYSRKIKQWLGKRYSKIYVSIDENRKVKISYELIPQLT
jgi:site-specific DNA recombinase